MIRRSCLWPLYASESLSTGEKHQWGIEKGAVRREIVFIRAFDSVASLSLIWDKRMAGAEAMTKVSTLRHALAINEMRGSSHPW